MFKFKTNKGSGIRITWASVVVNLFLAGLKCGVGFLAHSFALIGDGLHSFLDLATDLMALWGLKMSAHPGDEDHHYGHHKFSSLSTLFIASSSLISNSLCLTLDDIWPLTSSSNVI